MAAVQQEGWYSREIQSIAAALSCLAILYKAMPKLPIGLPRLLLLLPCLPVFAWVPFSTRLHSVRSVLSFSFLWTCPAKLLLHCWDVRPDPPGNGFLYYVTTVILPLRVKGKAAASAHAQQGAFFSHILNPFFFFATLNACGYREALPAWVIHVLYCLLVFFGLEWILALCRDIARMLLGVEIYPGSNNPFLASSLSDFWSRRWNLVASYMLRETVYAPVLRLLMQQRSPQELIDKKTFSASDGSVQIREFQQDSTCKDGRQGSSAGTGPGKMVRKPPLPARAVAMLASFLASGLIHELIFCCINQTRATGEVTMFFVVHGLATVLEVSLRRQLPAGWKVPWPVSNLCTVVFTFSTAAWLFMPPVTRSGSDLRIMAEFHSLQAAIANLFSMRLSWYNGVA